MRNYSLYGNHEKTNLVPDDRNLFLLHTWYMRETDTLYTLYKKYDTGEVILNTRVGPSVPIFIAKKNLERAEDFLPMSACNKYYVNYKQKSEEVKALLLTPKIARYKNDFGQWEEKVIYPKYPYGAEGLHPRLLFYDIPIESIVYMEYTMNRYELEPTHKIQMEKVEMPEVLDIAAFDIETCMDEDDNWFINTNTFVDNKTSTAYLDILKSDEFQRQDELLNDIPKFVKDVKDTFREMVNNSTLKGKKRETVVNVALDLIDRLNIKVRAFDNESELIRETTKTMFTDHKPNILMAFNTVYDIGMFHERITKLGLPDGTFNERGIGADFAKPPYTAQMNDKFEFYNNTHIAKDRGCKLQNISHTLIADYQVCYYNKRGTVNFDRTSLDATAERELGFGKYDYSDITPNIFELAREDFYYHSIYALIDSILLIILELLNNDIKDKLSYALAAKLPLEDSIFASRSTARATQTDLLVDGYVSGNNINKLLSMLNKEDLKVAKEYFGVDYRVDWEECRREVKFGGGIVADPTLYEYAYNSATTDGHQLKKEASLTLYRLERFLAYLDFKSFYPSNICAGNMSKQTLAGRLVAISAPDGDIVMDIRGKIDADGYRLNFGNINTTVINRDIISYANICNNLPSVDEIIRTQVPFDREPNKTAKKVMQYSIDIDPKAYTTKFIKVLQECNKTKRLKSEQDWDGKDNKFMLFNTGTFAYDSMGISIRYLNGNLIDKITDDPYKHMTDEPIYGTLVKDKVYIDSSMYKPIRNPLFEHNTELGWSEWLKLPEKDFIHLLCDTDVFTYMLKLDDDVCIFMTGELLYFPSSMFLRVYRKHPDKIKHMIPNYKYLKLDETVKLVFQWAYEEVSKTGESVAVTVEQHLQIKLISKADLEKIESYQLE